MNNLLKSCTTNSLLRFDLSIRMENCEQMTKGSFMIVTSRPVKHSASGRIRNGREDGGLMLI